MKETAQENRPTGAPADATPQDIDNYREDMEGSRQGYRERQTTTEADADAAKGAAILQAAFHTAPSSQKNAAITCVMSSYNPNTPEGKIGIFRCKQYAEYRAQDIKQDGFLVEHVVMYPITLADKKTGELIDCVRTVMVNPQGRRLSFVSAGIARGIQDLAETFGPMPFKPAIRVGVIEERNDAGNVFYCLDILTDKPG